VEEAMIRVAHVATIDLTHRYMLLPQLRRLRDEGFDVTAISAAGEHVPALEDEGIRHIALRNASRAWDPVADARMAAELHGIFRRERFHIVHTHNPKPGVIGRPVARAARVPVVVNTVHGFYATPDDRLRRRAPVMALEAFAARFSDLELFQSNEDLEWARRSGVVPAGRSRYLGNGIDLRRFDPNETSSERLDGLRSELGISPTAPVIGTVGRLVAEKGLRELLEAADRIRARFPDAVFLAVGPADDAKADAMAAREIEDRLVCTGFRTDVEDLLALMDVFVLPSWREGMPRSAIEAGAMGRARVLTDIRGCREVVRHGEDGLLVPVRDPTSLTAAILGLLEDPSERERLGRRARETAEVRFDENRVGDTIVESYRELLSQRGIVGRSLQGDWLRGITIRRARTRDVPSMVRLHAADLPTAFHTMLGEGFLRQLFLAQVRDPGCVALVAERDGDVVGYASAMASMRAFRRRFLLHHGLIAGIFATPRLLRPGVLRRVVETLRYPEQTEGLPDAEMAFIGVKPRIPPGVGTELCRGLLEGLGAQGVRKAKGFVGRDNRAMNVMVRRLGFQLRGEVTLHDGSPNYVYEVECPQPSLVS
jgi:glycosyltransferase involved in cell wall biosynthesis/L-amino acid N-acyltransferase YncA